MSTLLSQLIFVSKWKWWQTTDCLLGTDNWHKGSNGPLCQLSVPRRQSVVEQWPSSRSHLMDQERIRSGWWFSQICVNVLSSIQCFYCWLGSRNSTTTTTVLRPFFRDHPGEPVPEQNFWTLWCKGRLTEADTLTIWTGATPSGLSSAHLHLACKKTCSDYLQWFLSIRPSKTYSNYRKAD